jgi:DtxR family Mn-dependent transcriptional regulator
MEMKYYALQQDERMMKMQEPLSATVEEYLETIYNMAMEDEVVIGARLAEKFGVKAPTVTEMLKRLVRDGYIEMDNKRAITLTEVGNQRAEAVLRRHRLTERFLVDMLGMQWHQVHEEACRLEHFISGSVEERVITSLSHPTTCPHGNPIPGLVPDARNYLKDQHAIRLSSAQNDEVVTILCISEVVEDEEGLILYMHEKGLTPGTQLRILPQRVNNVQEPLESFRVQVDGREVSIDKASTAKIWVVLTPS